MDVNSWLDRIYDLIAIGYYVSISLLAPGLLGGISIDSYFLPCIRHALLGGLFRKKSNYSVKRASVAFLSGDVSNRLVVAKEKEKTREGSVYLQSWSSRSVCGISRYT